MAAKKLKLGRLPARYDARTVRLATYLPTALPPPPPTVDWSKGVKSFGVMANDRLGDCTCAAIGHAIQVWTANRTGKMVTVSDAAVIALYNKVNGGRDAGANMLDVLAKMTSDGIGDHKGIGYAAVDAGDEFRVATYLFGGTYVGLGMPAMASTQLNAGKDWDVPAGQSLTGKWLPGSWGGHCMWVCGYDDKYVYLITWGKIQRATWAWWHAYGERSDSEAYCLVSPPNDWWDAATYATAIPGVDYNGLCNRLANVAGKPEPYPVDPTPPPTGQSIVINDLVVGTTHFSGTLYPKP